MKKLPLVVLLSLAFCINVFAGELYVFFDSACMDKLSFKEKALTADYKLKSTANLISYNVKANNNEFIRLNIDPEGDQVVADMPLKTKNCSDLIWDEQFVKEINAFDTEVYVVSIEGDKYRVSQVNGASYFFSSENEMAYADADYGFNYNFKKNTQFSNLLSYGLKAKVNFSFHDDVHCPGEYHFYKSTKVKNLRENEIVLVPELGMIRDYTFSKKLKRNLREVELATVNDIPLINYMDQVCNKTTTPVDNIVSKAKAIDEKTKTVAAVTQEAPATEVIKETKTTKTVATTTETMESELLSSTTEKGATTLPMTSLPGAAETNMAIQTCAHIYRNADSGFYYDKNTGLPAEGDCGGITYSTGVMQNSDYQSTTLTTAMVSNSNQKVELTAEEEAVQAAVLAEAVANEKVIEPVITKENVITKEEVVVAENTKVIYKESAPKIIYKEPKVIYKESKPLVIDATIEPMDTKIETTTIASNITKTTPLSQSSDCNATPRTGHHIVRQGETLYRLSKQYSVSVEELISWNGLSTNEIKVCAMLRVQPEILFTQSTSAIAGNEFVSKGNRPVPSVATPTTKVASEPVVEKVVVAAPVVEKKFHYIAKGETFYAISKKYNVSVESLKKLNKLDDDYLKVGWRLEIPNGDVIVEPIIKREAIKPNTTETSEFSPKGGSSMKIPETTDTLLNNFNNQEVYHTVGQEETLNSIAMKYGTSVNALMSLNEMSEGEVLIPFQKIKVR